MGWVSTCRSIGQSNQHFFQHEVLGNKYKVLRSATIKNTWYAAVECPRTDGNDRKVVVAFVFLILWHPKAADGMTFSYKDQTEDMGPCETNCPDAILDLLTPIEQCDYGANGTVWARNWREACRAATAKRKQRPRLSKGTRFRLAEPVTFENGATFQEFEMFHPRRLIAYAVGGGLARYRLNREVLLTATLIEVH